MSHPPPHGLDEVDYEAIEAAVTETVRGRWFLNEFARRNRLVETRMLLDAMTRLEASVAANQAALPSADPSIRLLVQRIKEVAGCLDEVAREMRIAEVDERFWRAVEGQSRAVGGMMRSATPSKPVVEASSRPALDGPAAEADSKPPSLRLPRAELPPALSAKARTSDPASETLSPDPRVAALSGLDGLTLAKKLALFS